MTILGEHIFSQGNAYHYPSGEYPTLLSRELARATVHDPVDDGFEDVSLYGYPAL